MSPVCSKELRRARVAVIGAGTAGLAVARELKREGHSVTIFEAGDGVGGAWRFDGAATDSDLLGLDGSRFRVHSSMYPGLRTNLPRHMMSLCDFPFSTEMLAGRAQDSRTYPLHTEVLAFCEALAEAAGLHQHLVLHTRVVQIDPVLPSSAGHLPARQSLCQHPNLQWRVVTVTDSEHPAAAAGAASMEAVDQDTTQQPLQLKGQLQQDGPIDLQQQQPQPQQQEAGSQEGSQTAGQQEWVFDAVASCVGTFSEIALPQVPGMDQWPGLQLHSHNYRGAAQFKGQKVMVVGASFSGEEIARHIAKEAREVLHCARTFTGPGTARQQPPPTDGNITQHAAAQWQVNQQDQGGLSEPAHLPQQHLSQQQPQPMPEQQQEQQAHAKHQPQLQLLLEQQQGEIPPAPEPRPNITRLPMLAELRVDGSALLAGGQVVQGLDAVVYCTGYKYTLPWMDHLGLVQSDPGCLRPLFKHMFVPSVGPSLALCGLPWRCAKHPQFQLQGQLLARLLSGRAALPPQHEMEQEQQRLFDTMEAQGIPLRYTHCMASFMPTTELAYAEQLVKLAAGTPSDCQHTSSSDLPDRQQCQHAAGECQGQAPPLIQMPDWLANLAKATAGSILGRPDTFRDTWSEDNAALMAEADKAMHDLYVKQLGRQPTSACSQLY